MSFWKKVKRTAIVDRLVEEKLYEQVLREVESGVRRDGLWAKAFQKSHGDEQKAKALYFEYRLQSIKDEAEISAALAEINNSDDRIGDFEKCEKKVTDPVKPSKPIQKKKASNVKPVVKEIKHSKSSKFCNNGWHHDFKGKGICTVCGKPIQEEKASKTQSQAEAKNQGCIMLLMTTILFVVGGYIFLVLVLYL